MPFQEISQALGTTASYTISLYDSLGNPVTTFSGSEPLSATCWEGSSQSTLFSPTVAWLNGPAGTLTLTVSAANVTGLTTGDYRLQVLASSTSQLLWDGVLGLTDSPGSAANPTVYCQYQDCVDLYPQIGEMDSYHSATQFAFQRHRARTWMESVIQRSYRWSGYMGLESFGYPVLINPQWGTDGSSIQLKGWLDTNRLIVDDKTIELNAQYALGLALQTVVGTDKDSSAYQQMGYYFRQCALEGVKGYVAELDLTTNVTPSICTLPISCMIRSARY